MVPALITFELGGGREEEGAAVRATAACLESLECLECLECFELLASRWGQEASSWESLGREALVEKVHGGGLRPQ